MVDFRTPFQFGLSMSGRFAPQLTVAVALHEVLRAPDGTGRDWAQTTSSKRPVHTPSLRAVSHKNNLLPHLPLT